MKISYKLLLLLLLLLLVYFLTAISKVQS